MGFSSDFTVLAGCRGLIPNMRFIPVFVAGSICLASPAAIGDEANIERGREFADRNCSRCHAIGPASASPFDPAPPFRTFAKRWKLENLEESLAEGIVTGHSGMPEFKLTPRQIENFIGYLKTIQQQ